MKNSIKVIALAVAVLCFPVISSYADTAADTAIVSAINTKFSAAKTTSDLGVQVSSDNGIVTLSGKVNTDIEAAELVQLAESVDGVKDVKTTDLTVIKSTQNMADTYITAKVKGTYLREKLFGDANNSQSNIGVETTNGIVYLTGTVATQSVADKAVQLAKSINDVKSVESKLEVKPTM